MTKNRDDNPRHINNISMSSKDAKSSNIEKGTVNKYPNVKRRLSDDREDSISSRICLGNSYNLLNDEMDLEDSDMPIFKSKQDSALDLACPVVQAGASVSASSLVLAGTSVSAGASVQTGASAVSAGTLVRAGTSVSGCVPVQPETSTSVCIPEQAEVCVSGCALAQPDNVADQSSNLPQEVVESSYSEHDDVLPPIEVEPSPGKLETGRREDKSTISRSSVNRMQAQRAHNAHHRINVPNKNLDLEKKKKELEKNKKLKRPGVVKTSESSK